jgi:hypothetical protein
LQKTQDDLQLEKLKTENERREVAAEYERAQKIAQYNLQKESVATPSLVSLKKLETVQKLYKSMNIGEVELNTQGRQEPVVELLDKFIKLAD